MSILIYKQRHRHPNYKKTPKGNYAHIGYIATRPGAVKNKGMRHGLFGKLEPGAVKEFDTWQEAARLVRELSYRRVNMYRGIVTGMNGGLNNVRNHSGLLPLAGGSRPKG